MTQPDTTQLHQFLVDHFNLEELKTLCFNLGVEYEDLGGEGKSGKVRELVKAMQRQTRLEHLVAHLSIVRPDDYRQRFHETSLPDRRIHEKTGIELIRIQAGPFLYGSAGSDMMAIDREFPQRTVDLLEYWIGRYLVTNAEYQRFIKATGHRVPRHWNDNAPYYEKLGHPVVEVSWYDAKAYCDWAELLLPTEQQWEKAARGTDGRLWPWGNNWPSDKHGNFNGKLGRTTPVGKYSPQGDSACGCADMAGNVWEWTMSGYGHNGEQRVVRGGAWDHKVEMCRCAWRDGDLPYNWDARGGFRVVELLSDPGF